MIKNPQARPGRLTEVKIALNFYYTKQNLLTALQRQWIKFLKTANKSDAPICVALSGGRAAPQLFDSLAAITLEAIAKKQITAEVIKKLHFFWADERCVPPNSPESNYNIANLHLLQPLKIKHTQVHRIKGELQPQDAARLAIEDFLSLSAKKNNTAFDLIILGMGEDGHIASLFPDEPEDVVKSDLVYRPVVASKPPPNRITLGYQPIITAKHLWTVITGNNKSDAFQKSLPPQFSTPLGRILKSRKSTLIFYYPDY
ncbi:MAG: 6-phosphogluconolactonase [Limisphaerales bacterium]